MKNWKQNLVSLKDPIKKVIRVIDSNSFQIAFVVDAQNHLLGTVTDGDVRRGILHGVSLNKSVKYIMRREFVALKPGEHRSKAVAALLEKHATQLPHLDSAGRLIDVELLEKCSSADLRDNLVVIMAGGLGARLMPLTENTPKPLIHVGGRPILETIICNFLEQGFKKFFLTVNYKSTMLKDYFGDGSSWGADIRYIHEPKKMGTAGALSLLPKNNTRPVIVMNGDLLTKVSCEYLLDFHREHKADVTMCVKEVDFEVPYGVVRLDKHKVCAIDEKPVQRFFINAGIYILEPSLLNRIPKNVANDMPQLFERWIKKGCSVAAFPLREYWLDIGRMDDLERAREEYRAVFQ